MDVRSIEQKKIKVYYDGACYLCSSEISHYQNKDGRHLLEYIDINSSNFDAKKEGLDAKKVKAVFHIKTKQGQIVTGVDAFALIWQELGIFRVLSSIHSHFIGKKVMEFAYRVFAKVRPFLPRRRQCSTEACNL